jgi:hypothetical protein
MKKYKFSSVNSTSYLWNKVGIYLSPLFVLPISILLGVPSLISISLSLLTFGLVFLVFRKSVRVTLINSIIDNEGFGFVNHDRIPWNQVKWYRIDHNKADAIESIVIGLKDSSIIRFTLYKKIKEDNDWEIFKTDLIKMIEMNCPVLSSYYDSKFWDKLIMTLTLIEITIFILWLILDLNNSITIPILGAVLYGLLIFSLMVYSDRRRIMKRNKLILKNLSGQINK